MKKYGCKAGRRTLQRIWGTFLREGHTTVKKRSGRPKKCSRADEIAIVRKATTNRRASLNRVARELKTDHIDASAKTLGRVLKMKGYSRRGACSRPDLNPRQKGLRLAWAHTHQSWKVCRWSSVIFSDEKIFKSTSDKPFSLVTRKKGQRLLKSCVGRASKSGPSVHVWGSLGWRGVGPLRRVHGTLNAARYQQTIIFDIEQLGERLARKGPQKFTFQQDKAPAHFALSTRNFLEQKGVRLLPWPGNSPDLNPVEHAWAYVSRLLSNLLTLKTDEQAWEAIQNAWASIPLKVIRNWIASLPRRVRAVIDSDGDFTRY